MRKLLGIAGLILAGFLLFKLVGFVLKGVWWTLVFGLRIAVTAAVVLGAVYVYRRLTGKRRRRMSGEFGDRAA